MPEQKVQPGRVALRRLLVAMDLSTRSERGLDRALMLARRYKARLLLLHVVDDDQPPAVIKAERRQATALLHEQVAKRAASDDVRSGILVETGDPFRVIADVARRRDADLVVMGAHRRRPVGDLFVGTTVERVMRTGGQPVLMVNAEPVEPYRRVLVAVDMSEASANALRVGKARGFLDGVEVSILHGFMPLAKGMMAYAGVEERRINEHVAQSTAEAAARLRAFLQAQGYDGEGWATLVEEGPPFEVIRGAVERLRPDLLVIGTHGHTGIKRLLLGSVADRVLREVACDVLAVPPAGA